MKKRRCRFYLLADLMSWRLMQLIEDLNLTHWILSLRDCDEEEKKHILKVADLMSRSLIQLMIEDSDLTHQILSLRDC